MIRKHIAAFLVISLLSAIPSRGHAQSDNEFIGPFWEVRGRWTWTPDEETSFFLGNSRAKCERYIAEIRRDYAPGGLFEHASNRPFGLYIVDPDPNGAKPGPKLRSFKEALKTVKEAKDYVDEAKEILKNPKKLEPSTGLKDFIKNIQGAYERAKQAKEGLLAITAKVTDADFKKANALIGKFNRDLERYQDGPNGSAFSRFPKMTPIGPDTLKKAEPWKDAVRENLKQQNEKDRLDAEKTKIDQEREQLIEQRRQLEENPDPAKEAARVIRVRKYLEDEAKYEESLAAFAVANKTYSQQIAKLQPPAENTIGIISKDELAKKPVQKNQGVDLRETLVGRWIYASQKDEAKARTVFYIKQNGAIEASEYFANRQDQSRNQMHISGDQVSIVVIATWGPFQGQPYMKWNLRYEDGQLIGRYQVYNSNNGNGGSWTSPNEVILKKANK